MKGRKPMKNEVISIIVPVYNAEKYLRKCLDSIFDQSHQDLEVICINDGSTDQSESILLEYKNKYQNKMMVKTIPNGGQANARNVGIDLATGTFVCFVDSDDYLDKRMLEKLYKNIHENESDLAICDMERIFEGKVTLLERFFKYDINLNFIGATTIYEQPEIICYLMNAPFAKLIRKEFLNVNRIKFVKGYIYEDLVFVHEILSSNPVISMVNEKLYKYIVRDNSTMTSKKSKVTDMFVSYKNVYDAYERKGIADKFAKELEYLCLYHVMIGTSFRMWRSGQFGLFESIKQCREYVKKFGFQSKNSYIKKKGIVSRLYLRITMK